MTTRPTDRQLELIQIAVESAARACSSGFAQRVDPLEAEYLKAGRATLAWCQRAIPPAGPGRIVVELTGQQPDALLDACVLADGFHMDLLEEDGPEGNRARRDKRVRDRAYGALSRGALRQAKP